MRFRSSRGRHENEVKLDGEKSWGEYVGICRQGRFASNFLVRILFESILFSCSECGVCFVLQIMKEGSVIKL